MRRLILLLLLVAVLGSAGYYAHQSYETVKALPLVVEVKSAEAPRQAYDAGRVLQVWGRGSLAHACPVSADTAYTADHVAVVRDENGFGSVFPLMWGDQYGNAGTLRFNWSDRRRDLSYINAIDGPFNGWFRISRRLPEVGESVVIVGYDFDKGTDDRVVKAKVTAVVAGHMTYSTSPGSGSSGSCVLLESSGEIVGVNSAMVNGKGLGVLIAGGWDEVANEFKEGE